MKTIKLLYNRLNTIICAIAIHNLHYNPICLFNIDKILQDQENNATKYLHIIIDLTIKDINTQINKIQNDIYIQTQIKPEIFMDTLIKLRNKFTVFKDIDLQFEKTQILTRGLCPANQSNITNAMLFDIYCDITQNKKFTCKNKQYIEANILLLNEMISSVSKIKDYIDLNELDNVITLTLIIDLLIESTLYNNYINKYNMVFFESKLCINMVIIGYIIKILTQRPNPISAQYYNNSNSSPSHQPSARPSCVSSAQPSRCRSARPSRLPTSQPQSVPTVQPSRSPSMRPSGQQSVQPRTRPSSRTIGGRPYNSNSKSKYIGGSISKKIMYYNRTRSLVRHRNLHNRTKRSISLRIKSRRY